MILNNLNISEDTPHFPGFTSTPVDGCNYLDDRSFFIRVKDVILENLKTIGLFIKFISSNIKNIFTHKAMHVSKKDADFEVGNEENLCILIPGLLAPSHCWINYMKELKKLPNLRVVAIENQNFGFQKVEKTVTPIFEKMKAFCEKNPSKKVVIIGNSLGGLSSLLLENKLRKEGIQNKLFTASISGAFGTTYVNPITKEVAAIQHLPIVNLIIQMLPVSLLDSFSEGNEEVASAINYLRTNESTTKRVFISGKDDKVVTPPSNCHPLIGNNDKHYAYLRVGHVSSTFDSQIQQTVLEEARTFLE